MATVYQISDIQGFCRVLVASAMVSEDSIAAILANFREDYSRSSKYGASLTAFTSYLVANDLLTCWQVEMLRHGKCKGFFLDGYKIMDWVGHDATFVRYLAEDTRSQERVFLCVKPPSNVPLKDGQSEYWIEAFDP